MGGEGCGEIIRDYGRAWREFIKVGRVVWPVDILTTSHGVGAGGLKGGATGAAKWGGLRKVGLEEVGESGRVAAGFLGRMLIRGEGVRVDYERGRMWFERGAELVSPVLSQSTGSFSRLVYGWAGSGTLMTG